MKTIQFLLIEEIGGSKDMKPVYVCPEHIAYIVPDNVNNRTKISFVGGKEIVVNNSIDAVLKFLNVYSVSGK